MCEISSSKEVFLKAIPPYQRELDECGYRHQLVWMEEDRGPSKKKTKTRSKPKVWFNPPFSMNVQTNVGKEFLSLIDKHFPKGNPLHGIINRRTVKMSYRCLPSMGKKVANHNKRVLNSYTKNNNKEPATCNCQKSKKHECPVPGACNENGVIYQAKVSTSDGKIENYVGLAKNFKKRYSKHKRTLKSKTVDGQTTLSNYVWDRREKQLNPVVTWHYLEKHIPDFNPISGKCKLCTREKFQIVLNPSVATLNQRTEMFASCRHKGSYLLGDPPD